MSFLIRDIYDNMKTEVSAIGASKEKTFNEQFLAMMNHFLIKSVACIPSFDWEKWQVERQVKTLRKRDFKSTLSFDSLDELNRVI